MSKPFVLAAFLVLVLLAGCSAPAPAAGNPASVEVTRIVEVTRVVRETVPVEVTREVPVTRAVTVDREVVVTATPEPTAVPPANPPKVQLAEPQTIELGKVAITVNELALLDWESVKDQPAMKELAGYSAFDGIQVLGMLDMTVVNGTGKKISVYGDQGVLAVAAEQVELSKFMFFTQGDVGGDFLEGITSSAQLIFGLRQTAWSDLSAGVKAILEINAPSDAATYSRLADKPYRFDLVLEPVD